MKALASLLRHIAIRLNAQADDLMQIYRAAQENDPTFAAAQATLDAGREKLPQGRAGLLPSLTLSSNTVWNENDLSTRNGQSLPSSAITPTATS
jgi:outer membrane protein